MSDSESGGISIQDYRPWWQWLALGGGIGLAVCVGGHAAGAQWTSSAISGLVTWLIVLVICAAFRLLRIGRAVAPMLQESGEEASSSAIAQVIWPLCGFLGVLVALLLLERAYPFYFTQDDNLDSNLPVMLQGSRSFFSGQFPVWNPYQYMGSPTATLGYYAFTYPLTYLAYGVAKFVIGDANGMIDVFAFWHLLLGYLGMYWVLRRERCRPGIAMLGASCYALSGYALIFTRSYVQFSGIILWAPLLVACVQELARGKTGWKWMLAFGGCIGLSFHAGHIQMWAYMMLLIDFTIVLLMVAGATPLRAAGKCIASHFVGLAIAAPLLIPELLETHTAVRYPDNRGILEGLKGLLVPNTVSPSPHPAAWGAGYPIGEMYYSGTLFMMLGLVLLMSLLAMRWTKATVRANVWFVSGLVALILALGNRGILWSGLVRLPGFSHFRFPFKFLGLVDLFITIGGAVALERLMRGRGWKWKVEMPLVAVVWCLLAYHCTLATASFCNYSFTPFPEPDPGVLRLLLPDGERNYPKVLPSEVTPEGQLDVMNPFGYRSGDPQFLDSFMNQWPTLSGVFSIHGYDPLVNDSPTVRRMRDNVLSSPQRALAEYGVRYFLQYTRQDMPRGHVVFNWPGVRLVYENQSVHLYELPYVRPMVYPETIPDQALMVTFDVGGATIETAEMPQGGAVILNMLWREEFRAMAGAARLQVGPDEWGRIRIAVPAGTSRVRVAFCPPWGWGWLAAAVSLLCGIVAGVLSKDVMERASLG